MAPLHDICPILKTGWIWIDSREAESLCDVIEKAYDYDSRVLFVFGKEEEYKWIFFNNDKSSGTPAKPCGFTLLSS